MRRSSQMARVGAPQGPMRHRTMAEYALEQLREAIIMGELPAGTPLRLDELAPSLGMSISPIREAVRQPEALRRATPHVAGRAAGTSPRLRPGAPRCLRGARSRCGGSRPA